MLQPGFILNEDEIKKLTFLRCSTEPLIENWFKKTIDLFKSILLTSSLTVN